MYAKFVCALVPTKSPQEGLLLAPNAQLLKEWPNAFALCCIEIHVECQCIPPCSPIFLIHDVGNGCATLRVWWEPQLKPCPHSSIAHWTQTRRETLTASPQTRQVTDMDERTVFSKDIDA